MKTLQMNSPEVKRITKNMAMENLYLSEDLQKRALAIVNSGKPITIALIKKELENVKVQ
jgi:hypothetical protein